METVTRADAGVRQQFQQIRQRHAPRPPYVRNVILAFLVGGAICAVGQVVLSLFTAATGAAVEVAAAPTAVALIFLSALATGVGVYDELGRLGGMGASLPITGFANSIVSPAMEFKREGWVFGVGHRMFTIAGPVLVYGILTAVALGAVHFVLYGPR
ncbi:MAG: stage V sporulation protein AC [Clostridia bacterium]|nr:stage V sporulation protein AC [Clostridia bacterium]